MPGSYETIVIGGGPGAYGAAIRTARLGQRIAVVEGDKAAGRCLNCACISTKTILPTAEIFDEARDWVDLGVAHCCPSAIPKGKPGEPLRSPTPRRRSAPMSPERPPHRLGPRRPQKAGSELHLPELAECAELARLYGDHTIGNAAGQPTPVRASRADAKVAQVLDWRLGRAPA